MIKEVRKKTPEVGFDAWNAFVWTFEGFKTKRWKNIICVRKNMILIDIENAA